MESIQVIVFLICFVFTGNYGYVIEKCSETRISYQCECKSAYNTLCELSNDRAMCLNERITIVRTSKLTLSGLVCSEVRKYIRGMYTRLVLLDDFCGDLPDCRSEHRPLDEVLLRTSVFQDQSKMRTVTMTTITIGSGKEVRSITNEEDSSMIQLEIGGMNVQALIGVVGSIVFLSVTVGVGIGGMIKFVIGRRDNEGLVRQVAHEVANEVAHELTDIWQSHQAPGPPHHSPGASSVQHEHHHHEEEGEQMNQDAQPPQQQSSVPLSHSTPIHYQVEGQGARPKQATKTHPPPPPPRPPMPSASPILTDSATNVRKEYKVDSEKQVVICAPTVDELKRHKSSLRVVNKSTSDGDRSSIKRDPPKLFAYFANLKHGLKTRPESTEMKVFVEDGVAKK